MLTPASQAKTSVLVENNLTGESMQILRFKPQAFVLILISFCVAFAQTTPPPANYLTPVEGDYVVKDFKFKSGETLPELKFHYRTIGTPTKDANGVVRNAVLIMHGTGGTGAQFLSPQFGNVLFGPGQFTRRHVLLHHLARCHWSWRLK
jgi:hypothetical protein